MACVLVAPLGAAQAVPRAEGWVTDLAGILSQAKERELENRLESYRSGSSHEIAVLTIPTLEGGAIEEFALRVAREWKLGREDEHAAALLVIAAAERKTRIEVGRGLEGEVPDVVAGRILRDVLAPHFRAARYDEGVDAAISALVAAAGGDYGPIERATEDSSGAAGDLLVLALMLAFVWIATHSRRRGPRTWHGRGDDFGPVVIRGPENSRRRRSEDHGGHGSFGGFGGGGGFSGGGASGGW